MRLISRLPSYDSRHASWAASCLQVLSDLDLLTFNTCFLEPASDARASCRHEHLPWGEGYDIHGAAGKKLCIGLQFYAVVFTIAQ